MNPTVPGLELQHKEAQVNGIRMHYVEAGSGEPVLFLHGFPEFWYSWRHQLAALAPDYRVVAPDLRGYNHTENKGPYDVDTLVQDVLDLIHALGESSVHVVAHDWGGGIAWPLATNHPEAVRSLTVCNIPHPALTLKAVRNPRQLLRSWYIFFFQLPWLPELFVSSGNYQRMARTMIRQVRPGTFTRDDVRAFLASWRLQGLGGGINWYRAVFRHPRRLPNPVPMVTVPTLMIWGEGDTALGKELTFGTERYVHDLQIHYLPGVSHWVQQEAPREVNALLLAHLQRVRSIVTA